MAPTTPEETTPYLPEPGYFQMGVKILKRQCFGSAGCNVTYRVFVDTYTGPVPLDPDVTYEVTYEVSGVEDGPAINTLTIMGGESTSEAEEIASTTSPSKKLVAKATAVDIL